MIVLLGAIEDEDGQGRMRLLELGEPLLPADPQLVEDVEARLRRLGAVRVDGIVVKRNRTGGVFWRALGYRHHVEVARYVKNLRP